MAEKTLQELVIARGTKQKFDELPEKSPDALYFLTDGNTFVETNQGEENIGKFMRVGPDGMLRLSEFSGVWSVNGANGHVWLDGLNIAAQVGDEYKAVQSHLQDLSDEIDDLRLFKFPNAIIVGEPNIDHGQVSGFSADNYLQFPFIVDLHNRPFQIDFSFTTGNDVTTQQNILDSNFGLALAIANGHGLMAISHNGISWAGSVTGSLDIQPNTTYYARLSWNRMNYQTQLSTDGSSFTPDMNFGSTQSPFPRTMFIGGCKSEVTGHTPHPFGGTINLNKALLTVEGNVIWQGMDDAGLATRADVSLDNLDAAGKAKFDAKQDLISDLSTIRSNASSAKSTVDTHVANGTIHVTASDKIAWSQKQNKLIAGTNITIDEDTNTISATGGGSGLPDQTGHAGALLSTDGESASWVGKITMHNYTPQVTLAPGNIVPEDSRHVVAIGVRSTPGIDTVSIGGYPGGYRTTSVGCSAGTEGSYSTAIGCDAFALESYSIQLGAGTNGEANTFSVGLSETNNYKLLGSDGVIPDERISGNFAKKAMFQVVDSTPTTFESGVFYFVKKGA